MIKAILWDIGGVLLTDPQIDDFWKQTSGSKELRTLFGTGKLSFEEFSRRGSELLKINRETFSENYKKIYQEIYENNEVTEIVKKITCNNYILSDTNPIHGAFIMKEFADFFKLFKGIYLSYEIGMRKNSSAVFDFVAKKIRLDPSEILFIDNKNKLLNHATEAGYKTYLYQNPEELKEFLEKINML